jgi:hypothetical protein
VESTWGIEWNGIEHASGKVNYQGIPLIAPLPLTLTGWREWSNPCVSQNNNLEFFFYKHNTNTDARNIRALTPVNSYTHPIFMNTSFEWLDQHITTGVLLSTDMLSTTERIINSKYEQPCQV